MPQNSLEIAFLHVTNDIRNLLAWLVGSLSLSLSLLAVNGRMVLQVKHPTPITHIHNCLGLMMLLQLTSSSA